MIRQKEVCQVWERDLQLIRKEKWKPSSFLQKIAYRADLPARLFKLLENYLQSIESDGSKILVTNKLTPASLKKLIVDNHLCAIHIPGFCSLDVASALSNSAIKEYKQWKLGGTIKTDMFFAGGSIPKEVADNSWPEFYSYFSQREKFIKKQRALSEGKWPVDLLQSELDSAWPFGACTGHYMGLKLRPAIMRVMKKENGFSFPSPKYGFIHTDDFLRLDYSRATFTANIYLDIPKEGGKLHIWNVNLNRLKGVKNYLNGYILSLILTQKYIFNEEWQGKISKLLPKPKVIKPKKGDLVIFHSGRPHAIEPVMEGSRVTNQLFIFVRGQTPLIIGS